MLFALQAFAIPFVGIAGNMYNRIVMIGTGTILWGAMSLGMGFSTNYAEVRAVIPASDAAVHP